MAKDKTTPSSEECKVTVRLERKVGQPDYGNETLSVMAETYCAEGEQEAAFTDLTKRLRESLKPFVKEMRKG